MVRPVAWKTASSPAVDVRVEPHRDPADPRVGHLARDRAHPDQLVEPPLVGARAPRRARRRCASGRPRAGSPRAPPARSSPCCGTRAARSGGTRRRTPTDLRSRRGDRLLRQVRRVGAHVGDVAALVEPLRDRHRAPALKPSLRPASCCSVDVGERRLRALGERLRDSTDATGNWPVGEARRQRRRGVLVEQRRRRTPRASVPVSGSKSRPAARRLPSSVDEPGRRTRPRRRRRSVPSRSQ